jgi:hypothetical protein
VTLASRIEFGFAAHAPKVALRTYEMASKRTPSHCVPSASRTCVAPGGPAVAGRSGDCRRYPPSDATTSACRDGLTRNHSARFILRVHHRIACARWSTSKFSSREWLWSLSRWRRPGALFVTVRTMQVKKQSNESRDASCSGRQAGDHFSISNSSLIFVSTEFEPVTSGVTVTACPLISDNAVDDIVLQLV